MSTLKALYVENYKKIKVLSIEPGEDEPIILLTGKNCQGKTSVIEVMWWLLLGERYIPPDPIRKGTDRCEAIADFGDCYLRRVITKTKTTLDLLPKDGHPVPAPQSVLNRLIGPYAQNPLEFMRLSDTEKIAVIQKISPIYVTPYEFEETIGLPVPQKFVDAESGVVSDPITLFEMAKEHLYKVRAGVNQEVKRLQGVVESFTPPENADEIKPVSVTDLMAEKEFLWVAHNKMEEQKRDLYRREQELCDNRKAVADLQKEIAEREAYLKNLKEAVAVATASIATKEENLSKDRANFGETKPIDFTEINARIDGADERNKIAARIELHKKHEEEYRTKAAESANLTASMEKLIEYKKKLIEEAGMPVDGLSFEGGSVFYKGFPLAQSSGAEQIRVSCEICMSTHPELKLLLLDHGWAELDLESQKAFVDWAKEKKVQAMVTQVAEEPGTKGWHLVEGEVVAVNGEKPKPPEKPVIGRRARKKKENGEELWDEAVVDSVKQGPDQHVIPLVKPEDILPPRLTKGE